LVKAPLVISFVRDPQDRINDPLEVLRLLYIFLLLLLLLLLLLAFRIHDDSSSKNPRFHFAIIVMLGGIDAAINSDSRGWNS